MKRIIITEEEKNRILKQYNSNLLNITEALKTSVGGGWITLSDGKTKKSGCVKMVKYIKTNNKWVYDQSWAQGVSDINGNSTNASLGVPLKIKFNFSYLIMLATPDSFESAYLDENKVNSMFNNWKSGNTFKQVLFSKDKTKVNSETEADTKIELYFGGETINDYCKSQW